MGARKDNWDCGRDRSGDMAFSANLYRWARRGGRGAAIRPGSGTDEPRAKLSYSLAYPKG
ncbi:MAG: hypothetical protein Q8N27_04060 [Candidatus Hydromicrobium sp.]|nr:hypothetical protein [Candidatus Hydromicrobium sp.]